MFSNAYKLEKVRNRKRTTQLLSNSLHRQFVSILPILGVFILIFAIGSLPKTKYVAEQKSEDPKVSQVITRRILGEESHAFQASTTDEAVERIRLAFSRPLKVVIEDEEKRRVYELSERELRSIVTVNMSSDGLSPYFFIKTESLENIIKIDNQFNLVSEKSRRTLDKYAKKIHQAITDRYEFERFYSIYISSTGEPNTSGDYAKKYIEVDLSQQKLYTFYNGALIDSYPISSGDPSEHLTPTGEFKILNKAELGFSEIYDSWMPYWMAFQYSSELDAFFGIHELAYSILEEDPLTRSTDAIGTPSTGGCVALDIHDSKEVYDFAEVGTPLIILE